MVLRQIRFREAWPAGLIALLLAGALGLGACAGPRPSPGVEEHASASDAEAAGDAERPNIVLILADDVDPHHLGAYGGALPTPNLDRLAGSGMRFARAYTSSSMCTPSRYALLTGQYAGRTRAPRFLANNPTDAPYRLAWNTPLTEGNYVMHEMLSAAGYFTAFVGKYHMDKTRTGLNLPTLAAESNPTDEHTSRRLRAYQKGLQEGVKARTGADAAASILWKNYNDTPLDATRGMHSIEWMTNGAMRLLERAAAQNEPFFLSLATTALHGPNLATTLTEGDPRATPAGRLERPYRFHPPRDSVRAQLEREGVRIEHYSAGLALLDDQVGAILRRLDALGLAENTLVVFTADHGTEPGKATSYEQGARVPLVVRWPGHVSSGTISDALVQLTDLWPTFAEIAGARPPDSVRIDGESLRPLMKGRPGAFDARDYAYLENGYTRALTDGTKKYVALRFPDALTAAMQTGEHASNHLARPGSVQAVLAMTYYPHYFDADQLYDLRRDPYEQRNLASAPAYGDTLRQMKRALGRTLATFRHPYPLDVPPILRSARYAQMARRTRAARSVEDIGWWPDDFAWPPAEPDYAIRR